MNSLRRIIRALLWTVFVGGAMWLLRRLVLRASRAKSTSTKTGAFRGPSPASPIPLYRDPVCGTYVSPEISFTSAYAGQVEHFCSAECRDRHVRLARRASSA